MRRLTHQVNAGGSSGSSHPHHQRAGLVADVRQSTERSCILVKLAVGNKCKVSVKAFSVALKWLRWTFPSQTASSPSCIASLNFSSNTFRNTASVGSSRFAVASSKEKTVKQTFEVIYNDSWCNEAQVQNLYSCSEHMQYHEHAM